MRCHDEDADRLIGARQHDEPPVHRRPPNPGATPFVLRERPAYTGALPLDAASDREVEARRNLEQVGRILQRLDWDQAEIVRLRRETRAMLAGLAA